MRFSVRCAGRISRRTSPGSPGAAAASTPEKLAPAVEGLIQRVVESDRGAKRWCNLSRPRLLAEPFDVILDVQLKLGATAELKRVLHGGLPVSGLAKGFSPNARCRASPGNVDIRSISAGNC